MLRSLPPLIMKGACCACGSGIQRIWFGARIREAEMQQLVKHHHGWSRGRGSGSPPWLRTTGLSCEGSPAALDFQTLGSSSSCWSSSSLQLLSSSPPSSLSGKAPGWGNRCSPANAGFLSRSYGTAVIGGLGRTSRIALSPRSTSFKPDDAWLESQRLCPGCGIELQDENPKAPGFFQIPAPVKPPRARAFEDYEESVDDDDDIAFAKQNGAEIEEPKRQSETEGFDWSSMSESLEIDDLEDDNDDWNDIRSGDGGGRRKGGREKKRSRTRGKSGQGGDGEEAEEELEDLGAAAASGRPTVCARCHALRNYGRVKDESVENLLPDFDFEHVVGGRLRRATGRRVVVLMVIDAVDFDGSFPRMVASLLADTERELSRAWQEGKAANVPRLLIVLNKIDLLPGQLSPVRLEQWARRRSRAGGLTQISGVHIVSAFKGWGIDKLSKQLAEMVPRGDVWVIGAQNVGKSSLINALGRHPAPGGLGSEVGGGGVVEKKKNVLLTEAALPGTTVGVLKLEGILPGRAKLLDTPGLLHPHQMTTRLTREEQKLVQIRKVLKPRTFRVKVGHAISIGGLMRLVVERAPADSIYATVWASPFIPCHMGKAETAQDLYDKHIGEKLTPPLSRERVEELGRWVSRTAQVSGDKWNKSSVDVAVAGVGWVALALSGSALLEIWTYEGISVTVREAMVLDLAPVMERPGFAALKVSTKGKN